MNEPDKIAPGWQIFALGSAFFAALTAIFGKLAVNEINSNLATLLRTIVILLVATAVVAARNEWEPLDKISPRGLLMLVLSGVATGLSWLCYYQALRMAPASRVAPVDKLSVALVVILAAILLGETLTPKVVLGAILVLAGALVLAA